MTVKSNASATHVAVPHKTPEALALLRLSQVLQLIPVSRSHWWAGVATGKYPRGIKLSARVTCWRSDDIQKLIVSL